MLIAEQASRGILGEGGKGHSLYWLKLNGKEMYRIPCKVAKQSGRNQKAKVQISTNPVGLRLGRPIHF